MIEIQFHAVVNLMLLLSNQHFVHTNFYEPFIQMTIVSAVVTGIYSKWSSLNNNNFSMIEKLLL